MDKFGDWLNERIDSASKKTDHHGGAMSVGGIVDVTTLTVLNEVRNQFIDNSPLPIPEEPEEIDFGMRISELKRAIKTVMGNLASWETNKFWLELARRVIDTGKVEYAGYGGNVRANFAIFRKALNPDLVSACCGAELMTVKDGMTSFNPERPWLCEKCGEICAGKERG